MTKHQQIIKVLDAAIEELRQTPFIPFWMACLELTPYEELSELFKESENNPTTECQALKKEASNLGYSSFKLSVSDPKADYSHSHGVKIHAQLNDGAEWDTAMRETWREFDTPNEYFLTDNSLRMLHWLRSLRNTGSFSSKNKIGRQAGLRGEGSYSKLDDYFKEISRKTPHHVNYEKKGCYPSEYKAEIEKQANVDPPPSFNNPVFSGSLQAWDRDSVLAFAQMLENGVMDSDQADNKPFVLFKIHSRAKLIKALPNCHAYDRYYTNELKKFLGKIRLTRGIKVAAYLSDEASEGWVIGAALENDWTWELARQEIQKQQQREPAEKTYGLSTEAAKIFEWILDLHADEFELGMTPCVEEVAQEQMGIEDLSGNNSTAILTLLVEEINEKTPYSLRLIPWTYWGRDYHRILPKKTTEGDQDLIRRIRIRGIDKGVNLTSQQVEQTLEELWASGTQ